MREEPDKQFRHVDDYATGSDSYELSASVEQNGRYIEFTEGYLTVDEARAFVAWLQSALPPSDDPC